MPDAATSAYANTITRGVLYNAPRTKQGFGWLVRTMSEGHCAATLLQNLKPSPFIQSSVHLIKERTPCEMQAV